MDELLESIRTAIAPDATDEARKLGAASCRTILTALEVSVGDPISAGAPSTPALNATAIASVVGALRQLPPDQHLDLAIARLRAALPATAEAPPPEAAPLRFQIIQLPRVGGRP
ncbi:MAG: hypothetical protein WKG01_11325 [Kofleriaceae bacterium]